MGLFEDMAADNEPAKKWRAVLATLELLAAPGGLDLDKPGALAQLARTDRKALSTLWEMRRLGLAFPQPKAAHKRGVWQASRMAREAIIPWLQEQLKRGALL